MPYYGYQQQTAIVGYVPVYYAAPQHYNLYQPFYNGPEVLANAVAGQLVSGGPRYDYSASYSLQQNSFPFFKRYFSGEKPARKFTG